MEAFTCVCAAAIVIAIHAIFCLVYDDRDCRRCDGESRFYQNDERKFSHPCRKCGGSGKEKRMGARFWRAVLKGKR
jgi:DnaJ-class molecular chaperone